jgi:hypothetical protein
MTTAEALESPALPILLQLDAAGVRFKVDADVVLVSPRGVLTPEQRDVFRQHQEAVRVLVAITTDTGVQARRTLFEFQLTQTPAPRVPAFLFVADLPYLQGRCFSCADVLPEPRFARCWRCSLGWRLACRLPIPPDVAAALDSAKVIA